ncbi:MAG: hypothetical protein HYY95_09905 [Candidatus Rokubacteria bacterium]|nr:hypothetical protein [Candidatus Rokubacteria bacterium]MBI3105868.1 hypothetical protein [Candidatus Rokubacteria bacterium]
MSRAGLQVDVAIFGNQPVPTIVLEHASAAARHRRLVPERLIDLFALAGTPAEVAERARAIAGVPGVRRLVMVPQVPGQGFVEREELLRQFAATVIGRIV